MLRRIAHSFTLALLLSAAPAALDVAMEAPCALLATAEAQSGDVQLTAGRKGLFGFGLIGAELGLVVSGALPVDHYWPYLVIPPVTTAGGALAGHFLIDAKGQTNASIALLALGIALIVPSAVITVALESRAPSEEWEGEVPEDEEDDDGEDDDASRRRHVRELARAGDGVVRIGESGVHISLPGVHVTPLRSLHPDAPEASLATGREVRISLFTGVF